MSRPHLHSQFPIDVADELELGRLLEVGDGKDILEGGLEAGVLALLGHELHLEKFGVGLRLDVQKGGHGEDRLDLREIDPLVVRFLRFFEHAVSLSRRDRVPSRNPGIGTDRTLGPDRVHLLKLDDGSDFGELAS